MNADRFVGTWSLVSMETHTAHGRIVYPLGPDAVGCLVYSADGYMNVALMATKRVPFVSVSTDGFGQRGSLEERATAMSTYLSYAGPYQVRADRIIHQVQLSLFPNWIGGEQVRFYEFRENRLLLSTVPLPIDAGQRHSILIWERALDSPAEHSS